MTRESDSTIDADEEQSGFDPDAVDWEHFDFKAIDRTTTYTYRHADVLYYLYKQRGWNQQEIRDYFNVSKFTISRWMDHHGIGTGYGGSESVSIEDAIEGWRAQSSKLRKWRRRLSDA